MNGETKRFMYLEAGSYALLNLQGRESAKKLKRRVPREIGSSQES